ncbi:alpha/beta fold hydrolase [Mesorhizobium sp. L-8-3]|uniref:alpha/beta fold hydrolase n=1 Tax=Mesorhizobium sp. L-8-3 TaxID=2744522 RepID=UPI001FD35F31|nr:alpha/beta hydrolase [Mesorhizobium sp. L-8-3]
MGDDLFPGFRSDRLKGPGGPLFARVGGDGPPLVLLHGFPQTHVCWHRVAPALAKDFTVVCLDLRGYGASAAPRGDGRSTYSKRRMAEDVVAAMSELGHQRFSLAGHDRGARVGYRLGLDHPDRLERLALLDIVPTSIFWTQIRSGSFSAPHWTYLAGPSPQTEDEIGKDPVAYFDALLARWSSSGSLDAFDPRAHAAYRAAYMQPERIHAFCEDYRAGATSDVEADEADLAAGRSVACPTLLLWSSYLTRGEAAKAETPPQVWKRTFAPQAEEVQVDAGHFIPEEAPEATLAALSAFFKAGAS